MGNTKVKTYWSKTIMHIDDLVSPPEESAMVYTSFVTMQQGTEIRELFDEPKSLPLPSDDGIKEGLNFVPDL